jgi:hypothetical protein
MVNVGIFYDHLEHFMAIWYNLWPFGILCGHLLHISQFVMFGPRKIWQPSTLGECLSPQVGGKRLLIAIEVRRNAK